MKWIRTKFLNLVVEKLFYFGGFIIILLILGSIARYLDDELSIEQIKRGVFILMIYMIIVIAHFYLKEINKNRIT